MGVRAVETMAHMLLLSPKIEWGWRQVGADAFVVGYFTQSKVGWRVEFFSHWAVYFVGLFWVESGPQWDQPLNKYNKDLCLRLGFFLLWSKQFFRSSPLCTLQVLRTMKPLPFKQLVAYKRVSMGINGGCW